MDIMDKINYNFQKYINNMGYIVDIIKYAVEK